jgi:Tfp pilus assembly PilM family ATPase
MTALIDRIKGYFTQHPIPHSAFQISSHYLSGIRLSPKERKIKNYFILPMEKGVVEPSFSKKNIKNPGLLERKIREGLEKLSLSENNIACLIPELSLHAFVFSFDSLPPSRQEREQIIRFRIKKQMPMLPADARFSFLVIKSNKSEKILSAVARASVVQEYEDLFSRLRLKVRAIGVPTLSLFNLVRKDKGENLLLINIEENSLCLMAVVNSEIVLYRLKSYIPASEVDVSGFVENIIREIENTVNFVEDREKAKVHSLSIRVGLLESSEKILSLLKERLSFPLKGIESRLDAELGLQEKKILSPLLGQIL